MKAQECNRQRIDDFFEPSYEGADGELSEHLTTCASCRAYFDQRAAAREEWEEASAMLRPREFDSAGIADFSAGGTVLSGNVESVSIQAVLDSLSPSEDPHRLGRLGTYEVSGVVGVGGMGVVLKAVDPSLDRVVAIKVMAPQFANNEKARRRFSREARAAAAILHPNVIPIHAVDDTGNIPYLVMAYVRGDSLQKRLDQQGPLELQEVLRIGSQITAGLAAAHEQGLVHRDVKPENILLEGGVERVAITDFGLARAIDDNTVTQVGTIAGTPMFMSPEQARGEQVDQQSDLFSLGSVLYSMCTGRPPYQAETSYGVMRKIIDEEPTPLRSISPSIPEWMACVIEKLMASEKAARFESAEEVQKLLDLCLQHSQQPVAVELPNEMQAVLRPDAVDPPNSSATEEPQSRVFVAASLVLVAVATGFGLPFLTGQIGQSSGDSQAGAGSSKVAAATQVEQEDPPAAPANKLKSLGIRIAKDTTYLTEFEFAGGYPDFAAAVNAELRRNVKPDENVVARLMQFGLLPGARDIDMADMLWGTEQMDDYVAALRTPIRLSWEEELFPFAQAAQVSEQLPNQQNAITLPDLKLQRLRDAAKRTKYFSPFVTNNGAAFPPRQLSQSAMPTFRQMRSMTVVLQTTARAAAESGNADAAWNDLWSAMRLARLYSHDPLVEHQTFACEMEDKVIGRLLSLLESQQFTSAQLRGQLAEMDRLPAANADGVHVVQRCFAVDDILQLACHKLEIGDQGSVPGMNTLLEESKLPVDWNLALQRSNEWYDRLNAAIESIHPDSQSEDDSTANLASLESALNEIRKPVSPPDRGEFSALPPWRYGPSLEDKMGALTHLDERLKQIAKAPQETQAAETAGAIGDCVVAMRLPQILRTARKVQSTRQRRNNLQIAIALTAFYADYGQYPDKLSQLSPAYLPTISVDAFSGNPLVYRRTDSGCDLASEGPGLSLKTKPSSALGYAEGTVAGETKILKSPAKSLSGHSGLISNIAITPDGRWLLSGSSDQTAILWDLQSPVATPYRVLNGHTGRVHSVALRNDGQVMVTGSRDGTARVWNVESDSTIILEAGRAGSGPGFPGSGQTSPWPLNVVAMSPDGRWVATGDIRHTAFLWDMQAETPEKSNRLLEFKTTPSFNVEGTVEAPWLKMSSGGRWLAIGSFEPRMRLWNLQAKDPAAKPIEVATKEGVRHVTFSLDDARVLGGGEVVTDLTGDNPGAQAVALTEINRGIVGTAFDADGRVIVGSRTGIHRWDLSSPKQEVMEAQSGQHARSVFAMAVSPDGTRLAVCSQDQIVRVFDTQVELNQPPIAVIPHNDRCRAVAFASEKTLITGSEDGTLRVWDLSTPSPNSN